MGGYQAYSEYKDSSIEWLGEIPVHWRIISLRYACEFLNKKRIPLSAEERGSMVERIYPYYGASGIIDYVEDFIFDEPTVLIAEDGANLLSRSTALAFIAVGQYWVNNHAHILRPIKGPFEYWSYLLGIIKYDPWITGSAQPKLTKENLGSVELPLPTIPEQQAITRFLDHKTAQIDALIAKKEALLARLAAKRTALISHAVTKGLDPAAPMKDSGIEWLGKIPVHWKIGRTKYFARCFNGSTPSTKVPEYWEDGTVPWLSSGKVNEDIVTEPSKLISVQALRDCPLQIVPKGSVIIGMVGQGKTRGLSAYLGIDTTINQNMAAIVPGEKLNGRFLHFFLQQAYTPIRESGRGANQPALDVEMVSDIQIVLPPIKEQVEIVQKLEQNQERFNIAIRTIQQAIDKLKQYRTALITNAVTGKIDVRNVPLPQRT